jgi:hypothetical protein
MADNSGGKNDTKNIGKSTSGNDVIKVVLGGIPMLIKILLDSKKK